MVVLTADRTFTAALCKSFSRPFPAGSSSLSACSPVIAGSKCGTEVCLRAGDPNNPYKSLAYNGK